MCGIAGLVLNKDFNLGVEMTAKNLHRSFQLFKNGDIDIDKFFGKVWNYKSNINFIRYYKNEDEREYILNIINEISDETEVAYQKLKKINKARYPQLLEKKYEEYEKLLDCKYFLYDEISGWYRDIKKLYGGDIIDDHVIIFYKSLISIINAFDNRLEIRGRDSFGISLQFHLKNNEKSKHLNQIIKDDADKSCFIEENIGNEFLTTFIFKTANRIGSLGDNANDIRGQISKSIIMKKIVVDGNYISVSIVGHTRWASVGDVNIPNCHPIDNSGVKQKIDYPLVLSSLNGDIYNYRELIQSKKNNLDYNFNNIYTTDCQAISVSLTDIEFESSDFYNTINTFQGSYAIAVQASSKFGEIYLLKNGEQGLYLGISDDNIMFASDVYGLVEFCKYFIPIGSKSMVKISPMQPSINSDLKINIKNIYNGKITKIGINSFRSTNITTRDINKREYEHFLKKEIIETEPIVSRTILGYLQSDDLIDSNDFHNSVLCTENQVPNKIIEKLKSNKIRKIVITGMGTCYTAAVAISGYMRDMLQNFYPSIVIEPHVASDGSAFYLKNMMSDTLVIVIAQSGTTVDTNVYVQMAKERGASSIAIANKREGDVTFITDGTLYIGSGRDIEIAVPSTKTYTAQVALGYILALYFCCRSNKSGKQNKLISRNLKYIQKIPDLINDTFYSLESQQLDSIVKDISPKYNSWYMVYDESPNSVCAMEIRIKYSESCYHSLPYLNIDEIISFNVSNSFLTLITNKELSEYYGIIKYLLNNNNKILIITSGEVNFDKDLDNEALVIVNIPESEKYFSFIPTTIAGQLISYFIAKDLDQRKDYFSNLSIALNSKSNQYIDSWDLLVKAISAGLFNQGFDYEQIQNLDQLHSDYLDSIKKDEDIEKTKLILINYVDWLYQICRRPIDTIKHQAKTITVGAVRGSSAFIRHAESELSRVDKIDGDYRLDKISHISNPINELKDQIKELLSNNNGKHSFADCNKIYIYSLGIDECFIYFIINYINSYYSRFGINKEVIFLRQYNSKSLNNNNDTDIICIKLINQDYTNNDELIISDLDIRIIEYDFYMSGNNNVLNKFINSISEYEKVEKELLISFFISINILSNSIYNRLEYSEVKSEILNGVNSLFESWSYIVSSPSIEKQIVDCFDILVSKRNWKCLGSGVNYNSAKLVSKLFINHFNRSCAFDVLENHKHIDISAESIVINFIANIWRGGYQSDAFSEIEKMIAHNNVPIIITNIDDSRFDNKTVRVKKSHYDKYIVNTPIIKIPRIEEELAFIINILLMNRFLTIYNLKDWKGINSCFKEPSDFKFTQ